MLQTLKFSSPKNKKFSPKPHFIQMKKGTSLEGIRQDVFLDRYSLKDVEGKAMEAYPEQMWRRVAWGIAQVEKGAKTKKFWEDKFYEAMSGFKFVPAGRILSGAGTGYETTFYNCYVVPSPKDSRQGIMDNISLTVEIQARGGGVGLNLSSLRPRGARVKKVNGTSSGPVNWASLYSTANHDVIQQGGSRRGALMLMLNDWHPDVEEFITVKQDLTKIPGANLSVCISEAFMKAVKADADWGLVYPDLDHPKYDELWDGDLEGWKQKGGAVKVYRKVKARHLWDLVAEAAWRSAEPGAVFIDRYNEMSNSWYFEKIIATNPCLTGDSLVSTDKGLITIETLLSQKDTKVLIDSRLGDKKFMDVSRVVKTGVKDVYKLKTKDGYELKLTLDHKVLTKKGWVEAGKLTAEDKIYISNRKGSFGTEGTLEEGQILGWLVGDGTLKSAEAVLSFFGREKQELAPQFAHMVDSLVAGHDFSQRRYPVNYHNIKGRDEARVSSTRLFRYAFKNGIVPGDKLKVPTRVLTGTEEMQSGFLQALFTADGHVAGTPEKGVSVRLTSVSLDLLKDVQRVLLNFGVASKIYTERRKRGLRGLPDGRGGKKNYLCKAYHDLVISKDNLLRFAKEIGFLASYKNAKLIDALGDYKEGNYQEKFEAGFKNLTYAGREDVYDLTESQTHSFIANGLVVHNCGEQGLGAWGVCNLGHVNLAPFVKDGEMDYEGLVDHVKIVTRFLDNVIDANFYFSKENEKAQKYGIRRTGLGTLGLADALIKMGIRYGSQESLTVIEKIYKLIRDTAYDTSSDLAKEKGSFPKFIKEKYLQGKFIHKLPKEIRKKIAKQGIRNGILLTQAPTGTISLLAGVSSGIEPVYEFSYKRTDRTGVHIVNHPLYQEWLDKNPGRETPEYFVSASGLTPEEHIIVQAAVQKYVDASISKTVNAPNAHSVEDVKNLYNLAYELGCKGVTYFRDGSRQGVLSKTEETPKVEVKTGDGSPVKQRPVKAVGATYRLSTPVGIAFCTINQDEEGNPLEVFVNVGKAGSDVAAMAEALGRTISTALRFRGDLTPKERTREIAHQLSGIGGRRSVGFGANKILSLPDAVSYALSLHYGFRVNGNGNGNGHYETNGHSNGISGATLDVAGTAVVANGSKEPASQVGSIDPIVAAATSNGASEKHLNGHLGLEASAQNVGDICPSCGSGSLVYEEGCAKCYACGHSEC